MILAGFLIQMMLAVEPVHQTLTVPFNVWDVTARDLNGDGFKDLISFYGEREGEVDRKGLYVYIAGDGGRYPTKPTFEFPLPPDTGNAFFTTRDSQEFLAVLTKSGATLYGYDDGAFTEASRHEFDSLFPVRTRKPIFYRGVSVDLDGDESEEWIVPVSGGFDVWDGASRLVHLEGDVQSEANLFGGLNVVHQIPRVHVFDLPGQETKAIGIAGRERVDFYFGDSWKETVQRSLTTDADDRCETLSELEDINDDGYPDLMVTTLKGTASIEVLIQIYLADETLEYSEDPTFELTTKGGLAIPFLQDLNSDGKLDLLVRSFPITLRNIANYLLRNKISMKMETHLFADGAFSKKSSGSISVTADISEGREEIASAFGDFDGDGKTDMAVGAKSSSLHIFTHGKRGTLNSKAWKIIEAHTFGIARTSDLNGSGRDDIVIYHPLGKYQKDVEVIFF